MALFMLHTLLTPLSQFACDIKSSRHKLKKHLLATIPPFYGAGMGTNRTTVQQNIEKALKNGNFAFHSYDVTICFFFLFFIVLWNCHTCDSSTPHICLRPNAGPTTSYSDIQ